MVRFTSLCIAALAGGASAQNLAELVASQSDLTNLAAAVKASEIVSGALSTPDAGLTVFAPIDEAFGALGDAAAALLTPGWALHLDEVLLTHAIAGEALAASFTDGAQVETLNEELLAVSVADGSITLTSPANTISMVIEEDLQASNGVAHKVDGVLLPSLFNYDLLGLAELDGNFQTFIELIDTIGIPIPPKALLQSSHLPTLLLKNSELMLLRPSRTPRTLLHLQQFSDDI